MFPYFVYFSHSITPILFYTEFKKHIFQKQMTN